MKITLKDMQLRQLDARVRTLRPLTRARLPRHGWIRAVRQALGMTTTQLARRIGATRQAVVDLERREMLGTVTLGALRRAANALDCDVVYAVVPRVALREMRTRQARRQAERQLGSIAHSMRLEAQAVAASEYRRQLAEHADALARSWSRTLWDDTP